MRSLALFLLLLNITFFMWQKLWLPWLPWQPEQFKPVLQVVPPQTDLPTLQLVEELAQDTPETAKEPVTRKTVQEETKPQIAEMGVAETKTTLSDSRSLQVPLKTEPPVENLPTPEKREVEKEAKVEKKSPAEKELVMTCLEIGYYAQQSPAETSAQWFREKHKDIKVNVERRDTPVVTQTRVYLAPFKDRREANLVQQRLIQQGITDHALFVTDDSKNAISLGVYSNEDNAKKRVNQLKEKGYTDVKLELQQKNDTKYWLSVKIPTDRKEVVDAFRKTFKSTPVLKELSCQ